MVQALSPGRTCTATPACPPCGNGPALHDSTASLARIAEAAARDGVIAGDAPSEGGVGLGPRATIAAALNE
jgi:hypothetical protein